MANGPKGRPVEHTVRTGLLPFRMARSPFGFLRRFGEDMERLFEEFGLDIGLHTPRLVTRGNELLQRQAGLVPAAWSPKIDILERDRLFIIRADLPGLSKDDITVDVGDDALVIQGERRQKKEEEQVGRYVSECSYGYFYRAIPLPEGVDASKASARFRDGMLEVEMPGPPPTANRTRRIEIQS